MLSFLDSFQTIGICIGIFLLLFYFTKKPTGLPPGPTTWPIIGNIPTLIFNAVFRKEHIHELLTRLYMKYGEIFSFRIGTRTFIVLNDARLIKEAFQKADLCGRTTVSVIERLQNEQITKGAEMLNGETWMQHRKFVLSAFRDSGLGKLSFDELIRVEAGLLGDVIERMNGKAFDPKSLLMNAASNVVCSIVLGKRFDYDDRDFRNMLRVIAEKAKEFPKFIAGSTLCHLPFIGNMLFKNMNARRCQLAEDSFSFVRPIIKAHKRHFQEKRNPDFIDLYIKKTMENQKQTENKQYFKDEYLVSLADGMFTAGTETSSNTLAWCLYCMGVNTKMQLRIRDEILTTCGDHRLPTYSDRSEMPFTEAFLLEVLRLYTILPLAAPHIAVNAATLRGYTIPEGSLIIPNLWAVLHDPEVWSNPEEFEPTRFLDQDGNLINKVEELIPFGAGRLMCLGERIAKMALFIFLTHMVRRFEFKSTDKDLILKGTEGLTYAPPEFFISATKIR